ncbi:MAG TPA: FAD/NAD(P)-binding protein [Solirubrobacterales bacterium]|nr:FAD/NAD(P)-binding protein [Solirubrobacterales bacterium]
MNPRLPTVAVIGGGLSGTLVTANLLRYAARPLRIVLIERSGDFGPGVAYSTADPQHRLNVPAGRMSAFERAPLHLVTWASQKLERPVGHEEYLPRRLYGQYLRELLRDECARSGAARVDLMATEARRLFRTGPGVLGVLVELGDGDTVDADAAVIATGNLPPAGVPGLPDDPRVIRDPWAPGALEGIADEGDTLIVGSSLTAVDVALTVARKAPKGRITAISRSGLVPHTSLPGWHEPAPSPSLPSRPLPLVAMRGFLESHGRRMRSEGYGWREVVDGIRPCVPTFWQALSLADRRRFIAEMAREWDVRRHRIAPDSKVELEWLSQAGRLRFLAARIAAATAGDDSIDVTLAQEEGETTVHAAQIICCTGPGTDIRKAGGLVAAAIEDGLAVPDPLGLGVRAASCGALVDRSGSARTPIYTLGPPLRGQLWETTAAGEIRVQAEEVALELCHGLGVSPPPVDEAPIDLVG